MWFTGDILLARGVAAQIARTGQSPWAGWQQWLRQADLVVGNLEGAVGECGGASRGAPCFGIAADLVRLLVAAGFHALGIENNHAGDLGAAGREATRKALQAAGLAAVGFEESPYFLRVGELTVALVAVNQIPGAHGSPQSIPTPALRQKLRLARRLSHVVVVLAHWGVEYLEWPSRAQREAAEWLVGEGADVIVGHHPHVIQWPECVQGRPVFYSLGNHVFDQKYPSTKEGLIAECRLVGERVYAGALLTHTPARSTFPRLIGRSQRADQTLAACAFPIHRPLHVGDWELRAESVGDAIRLEGRDRGGRSWRSPPAPLLSAEVLRPDSGAELLFTLERRYSGLDGEIAPRPYVYEPGPQGLTARWRGSGLAWPLWDATLLDGATLCALHRDDSFLAPKPSSTGWRLAVYRWNGFGFSGLDDVVLEARCAARFR